jgi:hypothetical protein
MNWVNLLLLAVQVEEAALPAIEQIIAAVTGGKLSAAHLNTVNKGVAGALASLKTA